MEEPKGKYSEKRKSRRCEIAYRLSRFLIFLFILFSACIHGISSNLRAEADPSFTSGQIFQNPNSYEDKSVAWERER